MATKHFMTWKLLEKKQHLVLILLSTHKYQLLELTLTNGEADVIVCINISFLAKQVGSTKLNHFPKSSSLVTHTHTLISRDRVPCSNEWLLVA